eukprot:165688-Prymnesium_polylepis.1
MQDRFVASFISCEPLPRISRRTVWRTRSATGRRLAAAFWLGRIRRPQETHRTEGTGEWRRQGGLAAPPPRSARGCGGRGRRAPRSIGVADVSVRSFLSVRAGAKA